MRIPKTVPFVGFQLFAITALSLSLSTSHAQDPAPADPYVEILDSKTLEVINKAVAYYNTQEEISVIVETSSYISAPGQTDSNVVRTDVISKKPNLLKTTLKEGQGGEVISDGENLYLYLPMVDAYVKREAPKDFESMFQDQDVAIVSGLMLYSTFLRDDMKEVLLAGVDSGEYIGLEEEGEKKLHRIRLNRVDGATDFWIDAGEDAFVHRIQPDMTKMVEQMTAGGPAAGQVTMELNERYLEADMDPEITETTFVFQAPKGATEAGSLQEALTGAKSADSLKGEMAPAFTLPVYGGGNLDLAAHKGKDVVVLDFWATWCPPCRKGLPAISSLTEKYADKNVAIYAVNLAEDEDTVESFLKKSELDLVVAMDKSNEVAMEYGIVSIPTTVIIDKSGKVANVHIGLIPNLEQSLSAEIDALLEPTEAEEVSVN